MRRPQRSKKGFTLIELTIAMLITLTIMAAAVQLFKQSLETSELTMRRSEVQTEVRAALNQLERDLSQSGTGVPIGGIAIPSQATGGANPNFACDTSGCYVGVSIPFTQGILYKVTPGNGIGANITEPSDAIKITYVDPDLNWSAFSTTAITANGDSVTMPAGTAPAVTDPTNGILPGDVILLQNGVGAAVGVATSAGGSTINFGADPLNLNQTAAPTGNIKGIATPASNPVTYPATKVSRLIMVTYFIQRINTPDGPDSRLMRQVGAHPPVPVAEHIEDLQITYDIVDDTNGALVANLPNAASGNPPVPKPNQIRKININITGRSLRTGLNNGIQRVNLSTSVGPRNLSFRDRYN
ncbi:MAG TPA: prepilin-type N-terminal cleavage/methylation domain-containing protein [Candidatus Dormibacteraeota bacterium]|nr:prepilin-type N-terminal cleavage/methylation domain-containing protein [Candidatus Dormibacteraeota bacterium]